MKKYLLYFSWFLVLLALAAGCKKKELGIPAASTVANFTYTVDNSGYAPCEVTFTNSSINATGYSWDFDNGETSTEANPKTSYSKPGLYKVKLTCTPVNDVYYNQLVKELVVNVKDPLAGLSQVLYWTSRGTPVGNGHMVILNDSTPLVQDFVPTDLDRPYGIAVDTAHRKVYITDYLNGSITRYEVDGTNPVKILDVNVPGQELVGDPEAIFVYGDKIYWGRTGGIYRANLDGTNPEAFINTNGLPPEYPIDMQFDPVSNKIYLVNDKTDYSGGYWTVNFDGTGLTQLIPDIDGNAITVDLVHGKTYMAIYASPGTPATENGIYMCNLDGTNLTEIGQTGTKATWGIAIDSKRNKLFWSYKISNSNPDGKIIRSDLDGLNQEDWIKGVSPHAMKIAFVKL